MSRVQFIIEDAGDLPNAITVKLRTDGRTADNTPTMRAAMQVANELKLFLMGSEITLKKWEHVWGHGEVQKLALQEQWWKDHLAVTKSLLGKLGLIVSYARQGVLGPVQQQAFDNLLKDPEIEAMLEQPGAPLCRHCGGALELQKEEATGKRWWECPHCGNKY